jgi:hypothetical protein
MPKEIGKMNNCHQKLGKLSLRQGEKKRSTLKSNETDGQKKRSANTDNKGNLFVTVFAFAPAPKTDL